MLQPSRPGPPRPDLGPGLARHDRLVIHQLKRNYIVQIHFNCSYKLRIYFHTVRFAYRKMKDAKKLGASIKLRKEEIFEGGWGILKF